MGKQLQARAKELFDAARRAPAAERSALLARECAGDEPLRTVVEGLLADLEAAGEFLSAPTNGSEATSRRPLREGPGAVIGRYKLLEQIGEGGFGVVFLAEQREPVTRKVALKIIKLGMDTKQVIARFEAERQALAMMDHPNIARVLDAGETETGRPYFVMELVRGDPITAYCDRNSVTTKDRLDLFTQVCHAVQHAHQKGVIHRDIKPSNVLITVADGKPIPKVIDFGIAKATASKLTEKTLFTEHRALIGTPAYMSPEQAEMSGVDIDTRSDIYSLGVLLYELLTGTTPFDTKSLMAAGLAEIQRIIREVEPEKPSTRVSSRFSEPEAPAMGLRDPRPADTQTGERAPGTAVAARRRTDPISLSRSLRGDLDWIVMKALEKDRTRRYDTAAGLAQDVERYLKHEPVLAGPPSRAYRVRKFVRRNRALVTGTTLVAAALLAGIAGTTLGLMRADQRRAEAEAAREQTQKVSDFQSAMLSDVNAEAMGRGIKNRFREQVRAELERQYVGEFPNRRPRTREEIEVEMVSFDQRAGAVEPVDTARWVMNEFVLSRAAGALEKQFADQPLLKAQLHSAIGTTYTDLGLESAAEPHLRTALEIRKHELGDGHELVADSLKALAELLLRKDDFGAAEPLVREGLALERRIHGEESPQVAACLHMLARVLEKGKGDLNEAERLYRDVLARRRTLSGNEHPDAADAMSNLALFLTEHRGDFGSAEPLFQEALAILRKAHGNQHPSVATTLVCYAELFMGRADYAGAEALYREALAIQRTLRGDEHPDVALTLNLLAYAVGRMGDYDAAASLYHEELALRRKLVGDEHPSIAWTLDDLGYMSFYKGDYAAAESLAREALAIRRKRLGDRNALVARSLDKLGQNLRARGEYAAAELPLREALAMRREVLGESHPDVVRSLEILAALLSLKGEHATSEALYREALAIARELPGDKRDLCARVLFELAAALRLHGKPAEALPLVRESVALYQQRIPAQERDEHSHGDEHAKALEELAETHQALGQPAEGVAALREALVIRRERRDDLALATALARLGQRLVEQNQYAEAESVLRECAAIRERALPRDSSANWLLANARSVLGGAMARWGSSLIGSEPPAAIAKFTEAEPLLVESGEWLTRNAERIPQRVRTERVREALARVIRLYESWESVAPNTGKAEQAAMWRAKLEDLPGP